MFEGMNKVHSHLVGPVETGKPFSSEPYFRESEGPIADVMRKYTLDDPDQKLTDLTRPAKPPATVGDVLGDDGLAAVRADFCKPGPALTLARAYSPKPPADAVKDLTGYYATAVAALPLTGSGAKFLADYPPDAPGAKAVAAAVGRQLPPAAEARFKYLEDTILPQIRGDAAEKTAAAVRTLADSLRQDYARWVVGLDPKAVKKKYIGSDVTLTVAARLSDYEARKKELADLKARRGVDLGRSTLFAKIAAAKADAAAVRTELTKEATGLLAAAKTELAKVAGVKPPADPEVPELPVKLLDVVTMWTLTVAGAGLIFGLGTRVCALSCGIFLVTTYLTYPAFPWLPNPPGTEGNPVFVNKNSIEALACFALAAMPTGRWLGIDGLIHRLYWGDRAGPVA